MIVAILNQKGGSGKTTLSINIAHWFKLQGASVCLIDTDKQASARDWYEAGEGKILDVFGLDRSTLDIDFKKLNFKQDWIFIDGLSNISAMTAKSIALSDIVLVPIMPSPHDVRASNEIIELIKQRQSINNGKPKAAFIINRSIIHSNLLKETIEVINEFEFPYFINKTVSRLLYASSAITGETVFKEPQSEAAKEITNICHELKEFSNEIDLY